MSEPRPGPDVSRLSPRDAAIALRSFGRRFREATFTLDDDEDLATHIGSSGETTIAIVSRASRTLGLLQGALDETLDHDNPELSGAVIDPGQRPLPSAGSSDLATEVALLDAEAAQLADRVEHTRAADWSRPARITGTGQTVDALDIAREAVRTTSVELRAATDTMTEARAAR